MKTKRKFKTVLVAVLVITIFVTTAFQNIAAEEMTSDDLGTIFETKTDSDNGYAVYSAKFGDLKLSEQSLTVDINKELYPSTESLQFTADIPYDGLYTVGLSYKPLDDSIVDITLDLKIDGNNPFYEANRLTVPRIWEDSGFGTDSAGNQFVTEPKPYGQKYYHILKDNSGWSADEYLFSLTAGNHSVEISAVDGDFELEYFVFDIPEQTEKYKAPTSKDAIYNGDEIVIEGEKALIKNSYWLSAQCNSTSTSVSPKSPFYDVVNCIGGSNWSKSGETIVWETPVLKAGYYQLGFSYIQDSIIGGSVYRWLKIDGKTPFNEAKSIPFSYSYDFKKDIFKNSKGKPYLIYLSEGKHEISLTATLGEIYDVTASLNNTVSLISDLYLDIIMVTGQTIDVSRDYELFKQVPEMEARLKKIYNGLLKSKNLMIECTGNETGSQISVIDGMLRVVKEMIENKFYAHKYVSNFYSNYCSVAETLNDLKSMPLAIDSIILSAPNDELSDNSGNFFDNLLFSVKRFFYSFVKDYGSVSDSANKEDSLEVWVNWGRDQAQVLNTLIQTSFVPKYKTSVTVKVVNASMVQAVLSGKGPDIFLQHSRSEPVNLAMRGVLYDLSKFDDVNEVLKQFSPGADIPYRYKDGLYALPDTQTFYMMYYRTDVFSKLGLEVPKTWEDFVSVSTKLSRENLYTWIPYTQITDMTQANTGVGSLSLFPSLVLQKELSFYTDDQKATTLTTEPMIKAFTEWTDYYTKMKLPVTMNFYNRFRTGDCPLGIDIYTTYTTLKAAASEIDGLWNVAELPGSVSEDGKVSHISSGGGTACGILKSTKNPEMAWNLLKWWVSSDIQLSFSNNVEAVLGPAARVAVANTEAFDKMSWDVDMKENIITAHSNVREIPEIPGSYYLSRSIDHCFWNVINSNKKPKNMLLQWGAEVDDEIARKWEQYQDRK